jgi:hypothetical protein
MSDNSYIKVTVPDEVKTKAALAIKDSTGLTLAQWLRSKVYEAASLEDKG